MGTTWLRVAAWVVATTSVIGNLAVVVVLLSSRFRINVSKLLMANLAVADLLMGLYLLLIVAMDSHTIGAYFNYAIDWQNGKLLAASIFLTYLLTYLLLNCNCLHELNFQSKLDN